jgi:hypothetical protein
MITFVICATIVLCELIGVAGFVIYKRDANRAIVDQYRYSLMLQSGEDPCPMPPPSRPSEES